MSKKLKDLEQQLTTQEHTLKDSSFLSATSIADLNSKLALAQQLNAELQVCMHVCTYVHIHRLFAAYRILPHPHAT